MMGMRKKETGVVVVAGAGGDGGVCGRQGGSRSDILDLCDRKLWCKGMQQQQPQLRLLLPTNTNVPSALFDSAPLSEVLGRAVTVSRVNSLDIVLRDRLFLLGSPTSRSCGVRSFNFKLQ